MNPVAERELMQGVRVRKVFNRHFPEGVKIVDVDRERAKYKGRPIQSAYAQRKIENLFIIDSNEPTKVVFH